MTKTDFAPVSAADLMTQEFPLETAEESYRRGFRDGYGSALSDCPSTRQTRRTLAAMLRHFDSPLWDWVHGDCSCELPPPQLTPDSRTLPRASRRVG